MTQTRTEKEIHLGYQEETREEGRKESLSTQGTGEGEGPWQEGRCCILGRLVLNSIIVQHRGRVQSERGLFHYREAHH
jgi:hypothetical protein